MHLWLAVQVAESRFLNNKLVEVVGFMENISRECDVIRRLFVTVAC
jgi:hypothetical protein